MDWENFTSVTADIVLAADVLYDPGTTHVLHGSELWSHDAELRCLLLLAGTIPALVQVIKASLINNRVALETAPSNTCTAYIATTKRNMSTLQMFLNAVSEAQLHVQDLTFKAVSCPVQFYHHFALQPQRANIVLHEITCKASCM